LLLTILAEVAASHSRSAGRVKKHSLPVPTVSLNIAASGVDEDTDDVTRQLESAVRKMSRGSPGMTSPSRLSMTSPCRYGLGSPYLNDLALSSFRIGLSGLARGYEQYRESLLSLRPATEFGEASSDDLSSEWDSCSESDTSPITAGNFNLFPPPGTGLRKPDRSEDLPDPGTASGGCDRSSEEEAGSDDARPRSNSKRVRDRKKNLVRFPGIWRRRSVEIGRLQCELGKRIFLASLNGIFLMIHFNWNAQLIIF
jgi:hypothetical protein